VDTNDQNAVDFARVWAGTYQVEAGGYQGASPGALAGPNSTLDRWARAIGGTAAHEGGHNFGLSHIDGIHTLVAGEDSPKHHLMDTASRYSQADRAGYRRHFSDYEYSILASVVGLSVQTIQSWDLVNPNQQTANGLRMTILSTQAALTVAGPYTGPQSPWAAPTVTANGTMRFRNVDYNRYLVTWATAKTWNGGPNGQVPGGASFHIGTGLSGINFSQPNPIIVLGVDLLGSDGNTLALHPRVVAFDAGSFNRASGGFALRVIAPDGAPVNLSDVRVAMFPRLLSIDAMVAGDVRPTDILGVEMRPWREARVPLREEVGARDDVMIPIARLGDARQFVQRVDASSCADGGDRLGGPDVSECVPGISVSLFPATTLLVSISVTEPNARYWDPRRRAYVTGPLTTRLYHQVAGRHPDLDDNRIDDYIDIAGGNAVDRDRNGVIDRVQLPAPGTW
jgi:hypothetical protein